MNLQGRGAKGRGVGGGPKVVARALTLAEVSIHGIKSVVIATIIRHVNLANGTSWAADDGSPRQQKDRGPVRCPDQTSCKAGGGAAFRCLRIVALSCTPVLPISDCWTSANRQEHTRIDWTSSRISCAS